MAFKYLTIYQGHIENTEIKINVVVMKKTYTFDFIFMKYYVIR